MYAVLEKNISDKYLDALKLMTNWVTVSEWAIKFCELYPDLLEKANREAANQKNETTGLREIAARISSNISRGAYTGEIELDESERPRRVKFLSAEEATDHIQKEIDQDIAPLSRDQKIRKDLESLNTKEHYRLEEMQNIADSLNSFFRLDFEVDHASAVLNKNAPGRHHPDNLQLLLKSHNRMKNSTNWNRFSTDEQVEYIKAAVKIQGIVAKKMNVDLEEHVIESIIQRLKLVY